MPDPPAGPASLALRDRMSRMSPPSALRQRPQTQLWRACMGLLLLTVAACVAGCDSGSPEQPVAGGAVAAPGKALYEQHCAVCHQLTGRGLPGAFPPLAGSDWLQAHGTAETIELVLRGASGPMVVNGISYNGVMPPFAHLGDAEIAAILEYVYASWGNTSRPVTPADVAAQR